MKLSKKITKIANELLFENLSHCISDGFSNPIYRGITPDGDMTQRVATQFHALFDHAEELTYTLEIATGVIFIDEYRVSLERLKQVLLFLTMNYAKTKKSDNQIKEIEANLKDFVLIVHKLPNREKLTLNLNLDTQGYLDILKSMNSQEPNEDNQARDIETISSFSLFELHTELKRISLCITSFGEDLYPHLN